MKKAMSRLLPALLAALLALLTAAPALAAAPADGLYTVGVTSSSDMFRVTKCVLRVENGKMTATIVMSGSGYGSLFLGTAQEADAAPEDARIPFEEDAGGTHAFTFELPALDTEIAVAAYSIKYDKWYDRTLTFLSGSIRPYDAKPADGTYTVTAASGTLELSGCLLTVADGKMTAWALPSDSSVEAVCAGDAESAAESGAQGFRFAVESLDTAVKVSALSGGQWSEHYVTLDSATVSKADIIAADGVYSCDAVSDSGLFAVKSCVLTVENGKMTAAITVEGSKYACVYQGDAGDALQAPEAERIPAADNGDGSVTYTLSVAGLDRETAVATYSADKNKWYDRTLTLLSDSLRGEDGSPASLSAVSSPETSAEPSVDAGTAGQSVSFAFTGGSGKLKITCQELETKDGATYAKLVFSSSKYTWVEIGGVRYDNTGDDNGSIFTVPVTVNGVTDMSAETVAMGDAHVVEYRLYVYTDGTDAAVAAGAEDNAGTDAEPTAEPTSEPTAATGEDAAQKAESGRLGTTAIVIIVAVVAVAVIAIAAAAARTHKKRK